MIIKHLVCILNTFVGITRLTRWLSGKESSCQYRRCRKCRFDPWVGKIHWRRKWLLDPVFLPGKSHEHIPTSLFGKNSERIIGKFYQHTNCSLSVQFSHSVVSDSLQPHGLQHARFLYAPLSPGICSNSCPLSCWCRPTISSSVVPFSSCPQSFPASGSFPVKWG